MTDKYTKNEDIINILFGTMNFYNACSAKEISGVRAMTMLGLFAKYGGQNVKGTSRMISDNLNKSIVENGGKMICGKKVSGIVLEGGRVVGVEAGGVCIPGKIVVANAAPLNVFGEMLGKEKSPQITKFRDSLGKRELGRTGIIVYLGLKEDIRERLPHYETLVMPAHLNEEENFREIDRGNLRDTTYLVTMYNHCYEPATPGTSVLTLIGFGKYEPWREFEEDYHKGVKGKYNKKKNELADILIDRAIKDLGIGNLRELIEVREVSTPLTAVRYTLNTEGCMLGFRATPSLNTLKPLSPRTPVDGLYLASQWCRPGMGVLCAAFAGKLAFNAILKDYNI